MKNLNAFYSLLALASCVPILIAVLVASCVESKTEDSGVTFAESAYVSAPDPCPPDSIQYGEGFRDALTALALLQLELDLKKDRKNYGEMFQILAKRNNVKPDRRWK